MSSAESGSSEPRHPPAQKKYPLNLADLEDGAVEAADPGDTDRAEEWGPGAAFRPPALTEPITPVALLKALRHRWLLGPALGLLAGVAAGAGVWFLKPPKYTSVALLRVTPDKQHLLEDNTPSRTDFDHNTTYQKTQEALITSHPVIRAALRQEKVRQVPLLRNQDDPVQWLEDNLKAAFLENTDLLKVSLTASDATDLGNIVNAIQGAYMTEIVNGERDQQLAMLHDMEKIYASSQEKLRNQQEVLHRLADSLKTGDSQVLSIKQKNLLEEYADIRKELAAINSRLAESQVKLAVENTKLKAEAAGPAKEGGAAPPRSEAAQQALAAAVEKEVDADPVVQLEAVEVSHLEQLLGATELTTQANHPLRQRHEQELQKARELLDKARAKKRQEVSQRALQSVRAETEGLVLVTAEEIRVLEKQRDAMQEDANRLGREAEQLGTNSIELEMKRNDIEQSQGVVKALKTQKERLEMELQSTVDQRVSLIQAAEEAVPNKKAHLLETLLATVGGTFLGLFGVSLYEFRGRKIYSSAEVVDGLRMKVMGSIPALPRRELVGLPQSDAGAESYWSRVLIEAIDSVRTMLLHEGEGQASTVLLVTSARSGEGKTTLSGYLAASLARAGKRTLLVDGDLRHPSLHRLSDIPLSPGMCEVLDGKADAGEAIHPTAVEGLFLLPAGQYTREVGAALAQGKIQEVFKNLRTEFDFLVVDSSPVLSVPDALLIGKSADHALFSIRPALSQAPSVYAASERLKALRIKVLGTVVNGVRDKEIYPGTYLDKALVKG